MAQPLRRFSFSGRAIPRRGSATRKKRSQFLDMEVLRWKHPISWISHLENAKGCATRVPFSLRNQTASSGCATQTVPICWRQFHSRMQPARNKSRVPPFRGRRTGHPKFNFKGEATRPREVVILDASVSVETQRFAQRRQRWNLGRPFCNPRRSFLECIERSDKDPAF